MQPFYETENRRSTIRLYHEDCLEGMKKRLEPSSVNVVVTSPPYNIGVHYSKYNDQRPREQYLDWIEKVGEGARRVLSEDGSFFLNVGSIPSDPWTPLDIAQRLRSHFILQNVLHWIKSIAIYENNAETGSVPVDPISVGHYKPIGGARFVNDNHEYIFHFTKTGRAPLDRLAIGVPYQDKSNIRRWRSAAVGLHCRGSTWFIPYATIQSRARERPHPSTFPERLPEMCLRLHGLSRIKLAMDPFLGLGSSAIAAFRLKVPFIGFDIDRAYLNETRRRLQLIKRRGSRRTIRPKRETPVLDH